MKPEGWWAGLVVHAARLSLVVSTFAPGAVENVDFWQAIEMRDGAARASSGRRIAGR
jgi:hypothetical protein